MIFSSNCVQFYVDFKNAIKVFENVNSFEGICRGYYEIGWPGGLRKNFRIKKMSVLSYNLSFSKHYLYVYIL